MNSTPLRMSGHYVRKTEKRGQLDWMKSDVKLEDCGRRHVAGRSRRGYSPARCEAPKPVRNSRHHDPVDLWPHYEVINSVAIRTGATRRLQLMLRLDF